VLTADADIANVNDAGLATGCEKGHWCGCLRLRRSRNASFIQLPWYDEMQRSAPRVSMTRSLCEGMRQFRGVVAGDRSSIDVAGTGPATTAGCAVLTMAGSNCRR